MPFQSLRANLSDDVLHIINFSNYSLFSWLEKWFYANSTFIYVLSCVLYFPNESVFLIWISQVHIFEGPKFVCYFYQFGPTLSVGVLHIMNFGATIVFFY